ncbi:hypothetical protein CC2G_003146 [Coprinopsis cinerea AmutBmut pab1-1]|nr:hypothetical protein CC2G_003146 [Coprinopsis cinerea AmutBmut pab1-1]
MFQLNTLSEIPSNLAGITSSTNYQHSDIQTTSKTGIGTLNLLVPAECLSEIPSHSAGTSTTTTPRNANVVWDERGRIHIH